MMPDLRQGVRSVGGRRITAQVVRQVVVDGEAEQQGQSLLRATVVLTPMDPREIAIKPEGQRLWKWWHAASAAKLELGWYLLPDHDRLKKYEVMDLHDWGQARMYEYDFAETPR